MVAAPDLIAPPMMKIDKPTVSGHRQCFAVPAFFGSSTPVDESTDMTQPMTIEQWADMDEDEPGEFVDGYLVEEEVTDLLHERVVAWLVFVLMSWGKPRRALVFASGVKYAVSSTRGRKPDVSVYPPGTRLTRGNLARKAPMLMVEVLTPTARDVRRDRVEKMFEYARFGVRSYWIVDREVRRIECYELSADGRVFLSAIVAQGQFEVPNFDGLVLDLDDLWSEADLVDDDPVDEPSET